MYFQMKSKDPFPINIQRIRNDEGTLVGVRALEAAVIGGDELYDLWCWSLQELRGGNVHMKYRTPGRDGTVEGEEKVKLDDFGTNALRHQPQLSDPNAVVLEAWWAPNPSDVFCPHCGSLMESRFLDSLRRRQLNG